MFWLGAGISLFYIIALIWEHITGDFQKYGIMGYIVSIGVIGFGLFIMYKCRKPIINNYKTAKYGKEVYGMATKIYEKVREDDGKTYTFADFIIVVDNKAMLCSEVVGPTILMEERVGRRTTGISLRGCSEGNYVKLKYYNGDINFIANVKEDKIPYDIQCIIQNEIEQMQRTEDIKNENDRKTKVFVNGEVYENRD